MKKIQVIFICLLLAACGGNGQGLPLQGISGVTPAASHIWALTPNDRVVHRASGVSFPQEAGQYALMSTMDIREDGLDVTVSYKGSSKKGKDYPSTLTLYITNLPEISVTDYIDQAALAIMLRLKKKRFITDGHFTLEASTTPKGPYVLFEFKSNKGVRFRAGVWVARKGNWLLKCRFTYRVEKNKDEEFLNTFMEELFDKADIKDKGLSVILQNREGVPQDMEPIAQALKAISW